MIQTVEATTEGGERRLRISYIPTSHLDLYWLGDYQDCLRRGSQVIKAYLDRCLEMDDETFLIDSVVFAEHFLREWPDYAEPLRALVEAGRVNIGAEYVDCWEALVLGESHIRNIQIGQTWYERQFGSVGPLVSHPDLPGLIPQIAQIYRRAAIRYYVTARKAFRPGRVWRYVGPDSSSLLMLSYPEIYVFVPMTLDDVPMPHSSPSLWSLDLTDVSDRYPAGAVLVSGGAGDLTSPVDFVSKYGRDLREFVAEYRQTYPHLEFGYDSPTQFLAAYEGDGAPAVRELTGPVPSVWGVMADEELAFFRRVRDVERMLLAAETAAVVSGVLGSAAIPESSANWKGLFFERAYYKANVDVPMEHGHELDELWKMHVFTQDHNGGGEAGALSSFQKRVRQERCLTYAAEVIDHMQAAAGQRSPGRLAALIVFNPTLVASASTLELLSDSPEAELIASWADRDPSLSVQRSCSIWGTPTLAVVLPGVPPVSIATVVADDLVRSVGRCAANRGDHVVVDSPFVSLRVNAATGAVSSLTLKARNTEWAGDWGQLTAVPETGNDTTMKTDETSRVRATVSSIDAEGGPVFARVALTWSLLGCEFRQVFTAWGHSPCVDVAVAARWWGAERWQVRMDMPRVSEEADLTYGSPYYAAGWSEMPAEAGPSHHDEVGRDEFEAYREVQHWLHLKGDALGLTMTTEHPGFRFTRPDGLQAVLLRTPPSCGDPRLHWNNAGEHIWGFRLHLGPATWEEAFAPQLGEADWRKPHVAVRRDTKRSPAESLLRCDDRRIILSSLAPAPDPREAIVRLYNPTRDVVTATLSGLMTRGTASIVDLLGRSERDIIAPGALGIEFRPWQIVTLRLRRDDELTGDAA